MDADRPSRLPRIAGEFVGVALSGAVALLVPVWIHTQTQPNANPASLFPMLRTAVDHPRLASIIALGGIGLLAGFFARLHIALIGVATAAVLVVAMIVDMVADGTDHNLWPIELFCYFCFAVPGVLGACVGRFARTRIRPPRET
jgi:peptidoglycan/LPS O-acetylase OafA/YrhL